MCTILSTAHNSNVREGEALPPKYGPVSDNVGDDGKGEREREIENALPSNQRALSSNQCMGSGCRTHKQ